MTEYIIPDSGQIAGIKLKKSYSIRTVTLASGVAIDRIDLVNALRTITTDLREQEASDDVVAGIEWVRQLVERLVA